MEQSDVFSTANGCDFDRKVILIIFVISLHGQLSLRHIWTSHSELHKKISLLCFLDCGNVVRAVSLEYLGGGGGGGLLF